MPAQRRVQPGFDACSVALFTLLLMGAALHAQAQTPQVAGAADPITALVQRTAASDPPEPWAMSQIGEAFQRTDADRDGVISRKEAKMWTGLTRHFDRFDTDRDGKLSSAEFTQGLK